MTLNELYEGLLATRYPVAYSHFQDAVNAPFITYMETNSNNFNADNRVYLPVNGIRVELYTEKKDVAAENAVESVLADLCWEKYEQYIDAEHLYQITYEIEV